MRPAKLPLKCSCDKLSLHHITLLPFAEADEEFMVIIDEIESQNKREYRFLPAEPSSN
jgi:hypothetical protein